MNRRITAPLWIDPDPTRPAFAERTPIDAGTARQAAFHLVLAIGLIAAAWIVLP